MDPQSHQQAVYKPKHAEALLKLTELRCPTLLTGLFTEGVQCKT